MTARRRDLPVDLDLDPPMVDLDGAAQLGLELADQLRDRVARERETVRALRDYLENHAAG